MQKHFTRQDQPHLSGPQVTSRLPRVQLAIRRGNAKNLVREVRGPVYLIGSARDCDLVLGDAQFPAAFAYIFVGETGITLRCLGVDPEVTLNGQAVEKMDLSDGDRIRTGPFEFLVRIDWPVRDDESAAQPATQHRRSSTGSARRKAAEPRVEQLLDDIRQAMFPPTVGLSVHVGPDKPAIGPNAPRSSTRRRATA
jgi:hypothetical protein